MTVYQWLSNLTLLVQEEWLSCSRRLTVAVFRDEVKS